VQQYLQAGRTDKCIAVACIFSLAVKQCRINSCILCKCFLRHLHDHSLASTSLLHPHLLLGGQLSPTQLSRSLSHLQVGYPCLSLHGAKDQSDRESTINDFKSGVSNVLVATSIAARGLDVKDLVLVVNYEVPNHHEDYVHRVGRTGLYLFYQASRCAAYTHPLTISGLHAIDGSSCILTCMPQQSLDSLLSMLHAECDAAQLPLQIFHKQATCKTFAAVVTCSLSPGDTA